MSTTSISRDNSIDVQGQSNSVSADEITNGVVNTHVKVKVKVPPTSLLLPIPRLPIASSSKSPSPSTPTFSSSNPITNNEVKEKVVIDKSLLPHPAEDLSSDDDLLSWILVDQLGCMPNTKLGVHPQQVKFVGPTFKTDDVLNIVKDTIIKGNLQSAIQRLQEFHLIKSHLDSKMTIYQRERFQSHLRRYLLPLMPNSRLEIHLTTRYSFVTGHTELAVFATRPLTPGLVMQELQGSVVPLPDQWREEMEIGEDFAVAVNEAAGEETDSDNGGSDDEEEEEEDNDSESLYSTNTTNIRKDKGKGKEKERESENPENTRKGQRRSDRTKRRDFSIVWSGLKRCYQLFLGPARFINHDCNPNVELLRQGKYVTFRVLKPIRVGDELTTFYGGDYFGRNNIECLCLTCEQKAMGGFTPVSTNASNRESRSQSRDSSAGPSRQRTSSDVRDSVARDTKNAGPSSLRNVINTEKDDVSDDDESYVTAGPSQINGDEFNISKSIKSENDSESVNATPTKKMTFKITLPPSPTTESVTSDTDSPIDPPPRRERIIRKVVQNIKPWSFLQRPKKFIKQEQSQFEADYTEIADDLPSDFPRCATCAKALTEQIWFNNRYFEHCARCVRHAFIFELPWPAHKAQDVREYPPSHMIPPGYIPRKISTIALPTLSKQPKFVKPIESLPVSPGNDFERIETKAMKRARRLRDQIAAEEFFIESLREAAWSAQEAKEAAIEAKELAHKLLLETRAKAKLQRAEEKRKRDAKNIKGSGVWSRYAYISEDEILKKEAEKNQVLSGTRRGGRFRAKEDEEEMKKLAEKNLQEEEKEKFLALGISNSSPASQSSSKNNNHDEVDPEDCDSSSDNDDLNNSISSSSGSGTSTELVVDPRSLIKHNGKYRIHVEGRNKQDEDDEMEVSAAPELSIMKSSYYSKSTSNPIPVKTTATNGSSSSFSSTKIVEKHDPITGKIIKVKVNPPKSPTKPTSTKTSNANHSTPTTFRAIAPKKPENKTAPVKPFANISQPKINASINKSIPKSTSIPIIDLTLLDSDDDSVASDPGSSRKKQINSLCNNDKRDKKPNHPKKRVRSLDSPSNDISFINMLSGKDKHVSKSTSTSLATQNANIKTSNNGLPTKPVVPNMSSSSSSGKRTSAGSFSGSGSGSSSSVDITETVLDFVFAKKLNSHSDKKEKNKGKGKAKSQESPNQPIISSTAIEKKSPKIKLNINSHLANALSSSPTKIANTTTKQQPTSASSNGPSSILNDEEIEKDKLLSPLNGQSGYKYSPTSETRPNRVGHCSGNVIQSIINGNKEKNAPLILASQSQLNDKKRKRISEANEVSPSSSPSSSSTNLHPEKKKRTFFPTVISVPVVRSTQTSIPKPKHSIHQK
ncbi:uncharacterized protein L201_001090 [Kwoniella dendrophila CBS 6074]|uniref:SET domain-containing protein n=1 Tax=Kwoniella dendrophila CBS 6074 TaxID=1295534 RepID=A0AAX4JN27_9TREE